MPQSRMFATPAHTITPSRKLRGGGAELTSFWRTPGSPTRAGSLRAIPERWRAVIETNLLGTIYSTHAVLPTMLRQGSGHVLIMSSVSGRETYVGEPVYIASKWGLVGFAHALRLELIEAGIRVTVIEPGLVNTPLTRDNPKVRPLLDDIEPLTPEDVGQGGRLCLSATRTGRHQRNSCASPPATATRL